MVFGFVSSAANEQRNSTILSGGKRRRGEGGERRGRGRGEEEGEAFGGLSFHSA